MRDVLTAGGVVERDYVAAFVRVLRARYDKVADAELGLHAARAYGRETDAEHRWHTYAESVARHEHVYVIREKNADKRYQQRTHRIFYRAKSFHRAPFSRVRTR